MAEVPKPATVGAPQGPAAVAEEIRQRLINVERKINILLREQVPLMPAGLGSVAENLGDQLYGSRTYAQHGDDLAILNIFGMIGIKQPTYLDIGAHDPFKISNTALLYLRGSRGINVEANPRLIEAFRTQRAEDVNLNVGVAGTAGTMTFHLFDERSGLNTFDAERARKIEQTGRFKVRRTIEIPVTTVSAILDEHSPDKFPDLLSVDVEGLDLEVLASIDYSRSAPKLICVEGNSPTERRQLIAFAESKGYVLYFRAGANLFFLQTEYLPNIRL